MSYGVEAGDGVVVRNWGCTGAVTVAPELTVPEVVLILESGVAGERDCSKEPEGASRTRMVRCFSSQDVKTD